MVLRKILLFALIFMIIPLVSAIDEGQNITQQQLDNFNLESIDKQFLKCQKEEGIIVDEQYIYVPYSCLTLEVIEEQTLYTVIRGEYLGLIPKPYWKVCRDEYTLVQCTNWFKTNYLIPQVDNTVELTRSFVEFYQTNTYWDEIIQWLEDWSI